LIFDEFFFIFGHLVNKMNLNASIIKVVGLWSYIMTMGEVAFIGSKLVHLLSGDRINHSSEAGGILGPPV